MDSEVKKFIENYEKSAIFYPEYLSNHTAELERKIKNVIKYNKRLFLNDDFSHDVIDLLMTSKNLGTLGLICMVAITINYKQNEAILIMKKIINDNVFPLFSYYLFYFLRERKLGDIE